MSKLRMEDFGYRPSGPASAYGDQGTLSKVRNYKQPLSLNMAPVQQKAAQPAEALLKEYALKNALFSCRATTPVPQKRLYPSNAKRRQRQYRIKKGLGYR